MSEFKVGDRVRVVKEIMTEGVYRKGDRRWTHR